MTSGRAWWTAWVSKQLQENRQARVTGRVDEDSCSVDQPILTTTKHVSLMVNTNEIGPPHVLECHTKRIHPHRVRFYRILA